MKEDIYIVNMVKFKDIAYNTPLLIEVDTKTRQLVDTKTRPLVEAKAVCYKYKCRYDKKEEWVLICGRLERVIEKSKKDEDGIVYIFSHAKAGIYKGVDEIDYFAKDVRYESLTKEEYMDKIRIYEE